MTFNNNLDLDVAGDDCTPTSVAMAIGKAFPLYSARSTIDIFDGRYSDIFDGRYQLVVIVIFLMVVIVIFLLVVIVIFLLMKLYNNGRLTFVQ